MGRSQIVPGPGKLEGLTFTENVGEDVEREGLLKTPSRVATMYAELTAGYHVDPQPRP